MNISTRTLRIFFFVILLTVIGELSYFFISSFTKNVLNKITFLPFAKPTPIIDITTLDYLKSLQKGVVDSSILTNEYEGNIVSIDAKGGNVTYFPYKKPVAYKISIQILGKQGKKITFYYTQPDLKNLEFLQKTSDKTVPITIDDLKTDDYITITQSINWLSKPNPVKIKSIVIKR